jgi:hypothetical protein
MRLTHIYEEDELVKRQEEMQALAARYAMVQGLATGRSSGPETYYLAGQGTEPTPRGPPGPPAPATPAMSELTRDRERNEEAAAELRERAESEQNEAA